MSDFDFTKPQVPQPASPDGFDFTKPPPPAGSSAPFKPAQSRFYKSAVARELFQASGKQERFAQGQKLFEEAEKGGMFKATRMYYLEEGEVQLAIGPRPLDTVKAGEIFGEMAVISDRPRSASATAKTPCVTLSLDRNGLIAALEKNPEFALMLMSVMFDRLRFIAARLAARKSGAPAAREASVFDPVMLQQLEAALPRANVLRFQANASIMREGQAGLYMYVVKSGQVAISIKDKLVEVANAGGTFGEMALVDQSPRVANAMAVVYTELLTIDRPALLETVKSRPAFAVAMLRAVADRLRHMNAQLG